jgi:hypothetical protein
MDSIDDTPGVDLEIIHLKPLRSCLTSLWSSARFDAVQGTVALDVPSSGDRRSTVHYPA